jgi:cation diffusion facilitator family transporter
MSASSSDPARDGRQRLFAARLALVTGVVILLGKLGAYLATGSTAVLSDALESVVNVVAALLLLYSISLAAEPADSNHPYGHGKVEFFSAGVEGTLIVIAALVIGVEASRELWRGPELYNLDFGLVLIAVLTGLNAAVGRYLIRTGERTRSLALVADGKHLMTDVVTSVGVVAALIVVRLTGWVILDPLMALAVAANILRTGAALLRQAVAGLMDEADLELLGSLSQALEARRDPAWIDVHSLRAWRSGALHHIDLHLVVPRFYDAEQLHMQDDLVHAVTTMAVGGGETIVHFDPCRSRHCAGCRLEECPVRAHPLRAQEPISLERATRADETLDTGAPVGDQGKASKED